MAEELVLPRDFGARVRAARAYKDDLSQEDFGKLLDRSGMSGRTVRSWEAGHFPPSMARRAIVDRLAAVSGFPPEFFLGQTVVSPPAERLDRLAKGISQLEERFDAWQIEASRLALEVMTRLDAMQARQGHSRGKRQG